MRRPDRRRFLGIAASALGGTAIASGAVSSARQSSTGTGNGAAWPQYQFDAANTGHGNEVGPVTSLSPAWHFAGGEMGVVSAPAVGDGTLYFTSTAATETENMYGETTYETSGYVHAVNADSGTEQWRVDIDGLNSSPALADSTVVVTPNDSPVLALDAETGEERWSASSGAVPEYSPTVANETVFTSTGRALRALSVADGSEQWSYSPSLPGGVEGMSTVAVSEDTAVVNLVAGSGEELYAALDAETGEERWSTLFLSGSRFPPTIADGTVYFYAHGNLFAYDLVDGTEQWREPMDLEGEGAYYHDVSSVAVADGVIYAPEKPGVAARDAASGELVWRFGREGDDFAVSCAPVVADGVVYVGTNSGGLYTLDAETGEIRGQFLPDTALGVYEPPAVVDGTAYVGFFHLNEAEDRGQGVYALETGDTAVATAEPTVDFTWNVDRVFRDMPVTFERQDDPAGDLDRSEVTAEYHWEFGDGTGRSTDAETVEHTFTEGDTHEVTLRLRNSYGWTASTTKTVDVTDEPYQPPEPVITSDPPNAIDGTVGLGETIVLEATESEAGTNPIESYEWRRPSGEFDRQGASIEVTIDSCSVTGFELRVTDSYGVTARTEVELTPA